MHSSLRRFTTLLSYSALFLAVLCFAASFSDILHSPSIHAHCEVMRINRFRKRTNGNDEVSLNLNISGDLSSVFTWNTKQVFVFLTAEYDTLQNSRNQNLELSSQGIIKNADKQAICEISGVPIEEALFFRWPLIIFPPQIHLREVSLWDHIIHDKNQAKFETQSKNKYLLIDQGSHLLGKEIELVLNWHVVHKIGRTFQDKMSLLYFKLPDVYK